MNKELIVKYLNNQCSPAELEEVICWVKNSHGREDAKEEIIAYWKSASDDIEIDDQRISSIFDNILNQIESGNSTSIETPNEKRDYSNAFKMIFRAAVVLLIPVLLIFSYTISERNRLVQNSLQRLNDSLEVIAPLGSRTVVQLPDNTIIHLNSGSKIKYPQIFSGDSREVNLTGEAYFDVTHDDDKPFIVKTEYLNVKVLGTSFNVSAYADENIIETTLVKGKVQIENAKTNEELGIMVPGDHTDFNINDGTIISTKVSVDKFIAWIDGVTIFEEAPISEVAEKLSRMFNVEIIVNESIKDYNYTVTLIDEPLYQILDLMTLATPIKYSIQKREKKQDGTYSKQRIILDKK